MLVLVRTELTREQEAAFSNLGGCLMEGLDLFCRSSGKGV